MPPTPKTPKIEPPDGLSADAADLWDDLTEARAATITPEQLGALVQAVRLVTLADRLAAAVGDDLIVPGSQGQPVSNPALAEARMSRSAAVTCLRALGLASSVSASGPMAASEAGRALVGRRWAK